MSSAENSTIRKPVIEHIHDVQKHLTWIVLFVTLGSGVAFAINKYLVAFLQAPLDQKLYYTSPAGELSFMVKMCVIFGIVFALPVILYNIFRFFAPILDKENRKGLYKYAIWSFLLAYSGIAFAYYISLPSALKFLTNFGTANIQALINVNEYFSFALAYIAGFAVLFQLPLIVLFINRINRLKPSKMIGAQRYIIVGSFIVAAMLTPTPDPINQAIMAAPMVVLYQVSIILVLLTNRRTNKRLRKQQSIIKNNTIKETAPATTNLDNAYDKLPSMSKAYPYHGQQPLKPPKPRPQVMDIKPVTKPANLYHNKTSVSSRMQAKQRELMARSPMVGNEFTTKPKFVFEGL